MERVRGKLFLRNTMYRPGASVGAAHVVRWRHHLGKLPAQDELLDRFFLLVGELEAGT
jgi:hypothetical protein